LLYTYFQTSSTFSAHLHASPCLTVWPAFPPSQCSRRQVYSCARLTAKVSVHFRHSRHTLCQTRRMDRAFLPNSTKFYAACPHGDALIARLPRQALTIGASAGRGWRASLGSTSSRRRTAWPERINGRGPPSGPPSPSPWSSVAAHLRPSMRRPRLNHSASADAPRVYLSRWL
jgi:hypothetical protein